MTLSVISILHCWNKHANGLLIRPSFIIKCMSYSHYLAISNVESSCPGGQDMSSLESDVESVAKLVHKMCTIFLHFDKGILEDM